MKSPPIYVERLIRAPLEAVWEKTQNPAEHEKWDLRFSAIEYLPRESPDEPQRFLYETKIGFGLTIRGEGETRGDRLSDDERTSALRFWSDSPVSLIREGAGYWKYAARPDGSTRFLTWYDYEVRWGALGRLVDRLAFRPLIGWATAWSFDALGLWLEEGAEPSERRLRFWVDLWARLGLAAAWIYQGATPKLLFPESGELEILRASGLGPSAASAALLAIGVGQVLFGLSLLAIPHPRRLYAATIALLACLGVGALIAVPGLFILPFNPAALSFAMAGLAAAGWAASLSPALPRASRCRRNPDKRNQP